MPAAFWNFPPMVTGRHPRRQAPAPRRSPQPSCIHPEAHRPRLNRSPASPAWIRVKAPGSFGLFSGTQKIVRDNKLVTVCERPAAPTSA